MKTALTGFIFLMLSTAPCARAQAQSQPTSGEQSMAIRITAPRQNVRQTANFVDLRFELTNPTASAASSPTFKIQLDSNDPANHVVNAAEFYRFDCGQSRRDGSTGGC